ncbi:hypothetical protein [Actinomadura sp. BRA 177]|uniref:hypothetical protein n=1 Tax=Actinomadura sp. BRA 177 TaxID=2745202 RepID=UPI00159542A8|nr:hypothetical protein [Actinomadura sp. BRA 177]NVI92846.1 hypothetical protein [Actinomadura sp. BRA 177]
MAVQSRQIVLSQDFFHLALVFFVAALAETALLARSPLAYARRSSGRDDGPRQSASPPRG